MWGWLAAIVRGIIEPIVSAWQAFQHGRTSQQRDDALAAQKKLEAINEAHDRVNHPVVSSDWLRHGNHQTTDQDRSTKT